jgi:hypothetical protein
MMLVIFRVTTLAGAIFVFTMAASHKDLRGRSWSDERGVTK